MIRIYTDGCCKKDKRGAWGAVVLNGAATKLIGGYSENVTNNIMEITGPIEGLRACSYFPSKIKIYSDSTYLVDGFNQWLERWANSHWITSERKKPVKNQPLWQELYRLKKLKGMQAEAEWVRGHAENIWNRIADQTAEHCFAHRDGINIHFKSPTHLKLGYEEYIGSLRT